MQHPEMLQVKSKSRNKKAIACSKARRIIRKERQKKKPQKSNGTAMEVWSKKLLNSYTRASPIKNTEPTTKDRVPNRQHFILFLCTITSS
jgi:hypothetical protein